MLKGARTFLAVARVRRLKNVRCGYYCGHECCERRGVHPLALRDTGTPDRTSPYTGRLLCRSWRCDLLRPIDFELLRVKFELPPSLSLNYATNSISDDLTWIEI